MKKGFLIAGIIVSAIALILCVIANAFVISALIERKNAVDANGQLQSAMAIFVSVIFCFPSYIGQSVFNVAGIATTAQTLRSESQAIRITGTVFLVLNAVMLLVSAGIFIAFIAICNSPADNTTALLNFLNI